MTPKQEQELRKGVRKHLDLLIDVASPDKVTDNIMALFKAEAAQVDVAARIDELVQVSRKVDPTSGYVFAERLEQLHNQKKEAV